MAKPHLIVKNRANTQYCGLISNFSIEGRVGVEVQPTYLPNESAARCKSGRENRDAGGAVRGCVVQDPAVDGPGMEHEPPTAVAGVQENECTETRSTVLVTDLLGPPGQEKASASTEQENSRGTPLYVSCFALQGTLFLPNGRC